MTVCAAFMGLLPILWASGAGSDVMKRIAAPMIGGLVTSFVLELLILPGGVSAVEAAQPTVQSAHVLPEAAEGAPWTLNQRTSRPALFVSDAPVRPADACGPQEEKFKRRLVEQTSIQPGQRVLDLGCGTATLTLLAKQAAPEADVVGLDGDPAVLHIAREKARQRWCRISLVEGMSFSPPFPPESFDRIVSSLVLHHLTTENKRRTLEQAYRLLKPGDFAHCRLGAGAECPDARKAWECSSWMGLRPPPTTWPGD